MAMNQDSIQRRKHHSEFQLQKMEDIYDQTNGMVDAPHRHDYYTLLFVEQVSGIHMVDYRNFNFHEREVHFVSPGQVHQVAVDTRPKGWVLTFTKDFLIENNISDDFISNISLFNQFGDCPPLPLSMPLFERLVGIIRDIEVVIPSLQRYRNRALGVLLQLFLIYCNNSSKLAALRLKEDNPGVCILRDFKNLVDAKYQNWHQVNQYAREMHLSAKHLSTTIKKFTGLTAKEIIQNRIVLESKRLLLHTNQTIKEIAYHVGFDEPLYFSGFFKKKVGQSASEFRTIMKM
jgi:AraC-like DNA-binding protein